MNKNPMKSPGLFGTPQEDSTEGYLVAHIDGGARGNPGPAGYGVFIQDHTGRKVAELSEYLGSQTNNFAEYSGLVAALEYALKNGYRALRVVSDSELLVKQIRGEYKVRSESLLSIYQEAKELIRRLDSFQVRHVLREQNRDADRLANMAMDRGTNRRPTEAPAAPASTGAPKEISGIVMNGAVQLIDGSLPEGTRVVVRVRK